MKVLDTNHNRLYKAFKRSDKVWAQKGLRPIIRGIVAQRIIKTHTERQEKAYQKYLQSSVK
jgi:hypothetical protein